jgi:hypothetical protein
MKVICLFLRRENNFTPYKIVAKLGVLINFAHNRKK